MNSAFAWLNSLLTTFGKIFPRLVLIQKFYRGVLFQRNGNVTILQPGLRFYWPVIATLRLMTVASRTWEFSAIVTVGKSQGSAVTLPTATVASAIVRVRLVDVRKVIKAYHLKSLASGIVNAALCKEWANEVFASRRLYEERVRWNVTKELFAWGLEVEALDIVNVHESIAFGLPQPEWENRDQPAPGDDGSLIDRVLDRRR